MNSSEDFMKSFEELGKTYEYGNEYEYGNGNILRYGIS